MVSVSYASKNAYSAGKTSGVLKMDMERQYICLCIVEQGCILIKEDVHVHYCTTM